MKVLSGMDVMPQAGIELAQRRDSNDENLSENIFIALAQALTPVVPEGADSLRSRVLANVAARPKHLLQAEEGEFVRVLAGVYVKQLRADAQTETGLWRLEPGAIIPAHGHKHEEECLVVSGSINYAGRSLFSGDFLGAAKDEHQGAISSVTGALLLIRGELRGNKAAVC